MRRWSASHASVPGVSAVRSLTSCAVTMRPGGASAAADAAGEIALAARAARIIRGNRIALTGPGLTPRGPVMFDARPAPSLYWGRRTEASRPRSRGSPAPSRSEVPNRRQRARSLPAGADGAVVAHRGPEGPADEAGADETGHDLGHVHDR